MTTARSKAAEAPLVVLVDTREQAPLRFGADVVVERATLGEGDYTARGLEGVAAIERKSIGDLVGSLTFGRERFERELERLHGYAFRELVIEGDANAIAAGAYRSRATPQSILGSIAAIRVDFGIGVTWAGDAQLAAWLVERWLRRLVRQRLVTRRATRAKPTTRKRRPKQHMRRVRDPLRDRRQHDDPPFAPPAAVRRLGRLSTHPRRRSRAGDALARTLWVVDASAGGQSERSPSAPARARRR